MKKAVPMIVSEENFKEIFAFADQYSQLTKALYNAALFRIRQVFTGWDKGVNCTPLEQSVFDEIQCTKDTYSTFSCRRVLSYPALDKILRANKNPDFFAGLPMQTAQSIVRQAVTDFKAWLEALKAYKKDPSSFTGKPRMPKYCKADRKTFKVTNQDAALYPSNDGKGCLLKLPKIEKSRIPLSYLKDTSNLREIVFKPYYGKYIMTFIVEEMAPPFYPDMPNMAGVDLGTDNIAAIACTDGSSVVYKGGAILSSNQFFAKQRAGAVSILTKGKTYCHASSEFLNNLSLKHDCFLKDQFHKISLAIIKYCAAHRIGILVVGTNRLWKQHTSMSKKNNQKFVSIPHERLRWMISYKTLIAGIEVIWQEESYTSKADCTAGDMIPVYGKETTHPVFSGRRVERGLYLCKEGYCINADCNGAANILRKAFPHAWDECKDYHFLATPASIGFETLNPSPFPKRQKQRAANKKK